MRIFWKNCKKLPQPPTPRLSPAAGSSAPALLFSPTITTLSSSFLALNAFYSLEKEQNNYSKYSVFCFFRTFAPIFHFKLSSFCWQGAHNYSLSQGAGYPSYATGFAATSALVR